MSPPLCIVEEEEEEGCAAGNRALADPRVQRRSHARTSSLHQRRGTEQLLAAPELALRARSARLRWLSR